MYRDFESESCSQAIVWQVLISNELQDGFCAAERRFRKATEFHPDLIGPKYIGFEPILRR